MLELQLLSIGYADKPILSDINLTLPEGQMICLLGANGAGKSTLLRTLAGFIPPLSGKILLQGRDFLTISLSERSKAISVVLTERIDASYMKVREVVEMGRTPYTGFFGTLGREDKAIVDDAMEMVGIASLAGRAINTLSDGERQKAMLAKALAQQTPVILLDEPTAFLDFHAKVSILRLMRQLAHLTRKTILLSTHDVEMAIQLSDALWIVQDGKIQAGTTDILTESGILQHFLQAEGITYDTRTRTLEVKPTLPQQG